MKGGLTARPKKKSQKYLFLVFKMGHPLPSLAMAEPQLPEPMMQTLLSAIFCSCLCTVGSLKLQIKQCLTPCVTHSAQKIGLQFFLAAFVLWVL